PLATHIRDSGRRDLLNFEVGVRLVGRQLDVEVVDVERVGDVCDVAPEIPALVRAVAVDATAHGDAGAARATRARVPAGSSHAAGPSCATGAGRARRAS